MVAGKKHGVPMLRFPEFDDLWKYIKLNTRGHFIGGGTPSTNNLDYWSGNIAWISSSDLIDENIFTINCNRYITEQAIQESATKKVFPSSIIIVSRVGVGKVAVNKEIICTSQDFTNFVPKKDDNIFLAYLIKNKTSRLLSFIQGTSIKGFVKSDLGNLRISIPSLPEQNKIASFLSAVDDKIQQLSKKKVLLEQYKKGLMQQIFSQKLRFKREDGGAYPEWEEKRLRDVFSIGNGRDYKHIERGDIPVFGTGGYMTGVNSSLHDGETVFIGRKGTIDKPYYYNGKFWTVDTLFYTYNFIDTIPIFVYAIFQQINWKKHNEASGVPSLSKSTIEKIKIKLPSIEEQKKIASFLFAIDKKIELVKDQLADTRQFKKGLLQQMFV